MIAKALILAGYGLNCEEETAHAFETAGLSAQIRHINDLIDAPQELERVQILAIPGGFSYGDDTGSGNAFAQKMKLALWEPLRRFVERDTLTIGICNGCQIITNLGLIPAKTGAYGERVLAVTHNLTARYGCRWIDLRAAPLNKSPWLNGITQMHVPVAHGEGRFVMDKAVLSALETNGQIALRYIKPDGAPAAGEFPYNPNGSTADIAGVTDPSGRILALMPHPERGMFTWQRDDYDRLKDQARRSGKPLPEEADGLTLFRNAAAYFEVAKKKVG
jgi:phosphoribosylformylglycinamidine synthase I